MEGKKEVSGQRVEKDLEELGDEKNMTKIYYTKHIFK